MALEGYFLFQGDRTVCGGKIITGAEDTEFFRAITGAGKR
ncbi:Uncharacterised protein [Klebsiella pneumoniae]|nr:Uncharacterised protein [Klebsiella pneumoniae]